MNFPFSITWHLHWRIAILPFVQQAKWRVLSVYRPPTWIHDFHVHGKYSPQWEWVGSPWKHGSCILNFNSHMSTIKDTRVPSISSVWCPLHWISYFRLQFSCMKKFEGLMNSQAISLPQKFRSYRVYISITPVTIFFITPVTIFSCHLELYTSNLIVQRSH